MSWARVTPSTQDAPDDLKQLSLEQLGNVEVTSASKEPEKVWRTPAAIYVITQEDIRRSGATSIPEILRLAPGVEVARIDSDHWAVGIRGFNSGFSRSVLVLIDGRSAYTPLFEGVYWDVQNVLLEDVERIEVIRGPGGTIWGANAVNGVINIITKSAKDTDGTLLTVGGGNIDEGTGGVRFGSSVGQNFSYRVYGMGFLRGFEAHTDHDPFDEWRMGQIGFRTDWKDGDRDAFTFQGDAYSGANGERKNIAFFSPPSQANLDGTAFVSGGNLLARWRHQMDEGSDFQVQAYFDRTNRQDLQFGETRDTFDIDFIHHLVLPHHQDLIWGLGARLSPSNFIQTQATVNFVPHQETDSIYSGFVQYEFPLGTDKLSLTLGSKLEHNNFSGFEYQPGARLLWTPGPQQSFWAAVTRAVRTPSRLDQDLALTGLVSAGPPIPIFIEILGDRTFVSERLVGYEAGYRQSITRRVYVDLSAFFNNYDDIQSFGKPSISIATSPSPTHVLITVPWANGLLGNTDGMEISPDWKITDRWHLKGSYSYLEMHLKDKPGATDTGTAASYTGSSPHHEAVIQSLFNLPMHIEFDPTYRYVAALPAQSIKSYSSMDARLGWRFAGQFEVSVVGQNLFQPSHQEFGNSPPPNIGIDRSVYAKIIWNTSKR